MLDASMIIPPYGHDPVVETVMPMLEFTQIVHTPVTPLLSVKSYVRVNDWAATEAFQTNWLPADVEALMTGGTPNSCVQAVGLAPPGRQKVVSGDVGTAAYLEDGVSGFVLAHNAPDEIAATLARAIAERARWPEIGEAARRVFRDHFSEARFEQRLLATIGDPVAVEQAAD